MIYFTLIQKKQVFWETLMLKWTFWDYSGD